MTDFFASSRLTYRAVDPAIDTDLLFALSKDSESQLQVRPILPPPPTRASAEQYATEMSKDYLLAVMICLPASSSTSPSSSNPDSSPAPIGWLTIDTLPPPSSIHRRGNLGIAIAAAHQRKGYGTEALEWSLTYGFEMAGFHKMALSVVGWNAGAERLYERLGFVKEGVRRDFFWAKGRFWDSVDMGMLEGEWRERYRGEKMIEIRGEELEEEDYVFV